MHIRFRGGDVRIPLGPQDGGQQQAQKQGNDGDNYKEFDEREAAAGAARDGRRETGVRVGQAGMRLTMLRSYAVNNLLVSAANDGSAESCTYPRSRDRIR